MKKNWIGIALLLALAGILGIMPIHAEDITESDIPVITDQEAQRLSSQHESVALTEKQAVALSRHPRLEKYLEKHPQLANRLAAHPRACHYLYQHPRFAKFLKKHPRIHKKWQAAHQRWERMPPAQKAKLKRHPKAQQNRRP